MSNNRQNIPSLGILFILIGVFCLSINDLMIKQLSDGYPLYQIVFVRSVIGLFLTLIIVQLEGGWSILRTSRPWLHTMRGILIVIANMTFFLALAVLPLADATALFFRRPIIHNNIIDTSSWRKSRTDAVGCCCCRFCGRSHHATTMGK